MHLLLCTTPDQSHYLPRFSKLGVLHGHRVSVLMQTPSTLSELEYKCKQTGVEGIIIANEALLARALDGLADFNKPVRDKRLTLDDYQGSLISIKGIPAVVINPPEHIMSVAYGAFVFSRFLAKLTKPEEWYPQTGFTWTLGTPENLQEIYDRFARFARIIGVDVETPDPDLPTHPINCITFCAYYPSTHTTESVVIPIDSMFMLSWVRNFAALPITKVMQGGTYDAVRCLRFNIPISHWLLDTLNLFHCYYSELPKRLDFVTAFALRNVRFWKDDGKTGNLEDYYRYNALDGWATVNSCLSLLLELPAWAISNYLQEFPLNFPAIHCELEGWRVDPVAFAKGKSSQEEIWAKSLASLRVMLRAPEYNPGSWQQNKKVFAIVGCGDLPTTSEKDMKKAEFRNPIAARIVGDIRNYKKSRKLDGTYFDEDKMWKFSPTYWRVFYRINPAGTDTGRPSSSESSFWTGYNIQNIKRGPIVKQYLVSDPGWKLAEPDFEQSESRCTFYLAGETRGIAVVESGKDFHCWNAQLFFGFKYEDLWDETTRKCKTLEAKEIRDEPAKRTNHGANYNMMGKTMLETVGPKVASRMKVLLKLPASMTLEKVCQYCLDIWSKTYPNVKGLYYDETIKAVELTRKLVSPLGWTRHFFGDHKSNKHYLNALVAHGPQNLSVGIINKGFYRIWWESIYGKYRNVVRIKAHIHDSIPFQFRDGAEWCVESIRADMRIPTEVTGADKIRRTLVIPVGMAYGKERWSELK